MHSKQIEPLATQRMAAPDVDYEGNADRPGALTTEHRTRLPEEGVESVGEGSEGSAEAPAEEEGELLPPGQLLGDSLDNPAAAAGRPGRTQEWHPAWGVLANPHVRRQAALTLSMALLVLVLYVKSSAVLVFFFTILFSTGCFICLRIAIEGRALDRRYQVVPQQAAQTGAAPAAQSRPSLFRFRWRRSGAAAAGSGRDRRQDTAYQAHPFDLRRGTGFAGVSPTALRLAVMERDFNANDYDLLLRLDETNHRRWQGMSQSAIERYPAFVVGSPKSQSSQHTCSICLEPRAKGERIRALPCMHAFHADCVDKWLREKAECPVCKYNLLES
eukprot:g6123.t1